MYICQLNIENLRCFGEGASRFELPLKPGLTALVGENEAGKTAVIDALRFALGTTDQEWHRLEDTDFHNGETGRQIKIVCKFKGLNGRERRAFAEYLTYSENDTHEPILYVNWIAEDTGEVYRGRPYRRVQVRSGKDGEGPTVAQEARELLRTTYLRPLRDADQALNAGRHSRLSQVLQHSDQIRTAGNDYSPETAYDHTKLKELNVLGIGDLANALLKEQKGIVSARNKINKHLENLSLHDDGLESSIEVSGIKANDNVRLRQLLEKIELGLGGVGKVGLGSNNLLFMSCELLLLSEEKDGNRMLLMEEPEAHLHAQRQLQVMKFMQKLAKDSHIQVVITTHSPNLASVIELDNMVMIRKGRAFSLAAGQTELEPSDYRFLERFLDATKANLFFARGVMIVEGDSENILLPTLARLVDRDFTEHGVSIVNVGSVGLRRYARIFQRKGANNKGRDKQLDIPVACLTDADVMPDCAPVIVGKVKESETWPETNRRRWRTKRDIGDEEALKAHRKEKAGKASGQCVETFISDEWTLEYDLTVGPRNDDGTFPCGFAEDVFVAACLALNDDNINARTVAIAEVEKAAIEAFTAIREKAAKIGGRDGSEVLGSYVYAKFAKHNASKPIAAQYLAERLRLKHDRGELTPIHLRSLLPKYLVEAIDYVCGMRVVPVATTNREDAVVE